MNTEERGTFECPICGVDTPHRHTDEEIDARSRRQQLDFKVRELLRADMDRAKQAFMDFEASCATCRTMSDAIARKFNLGITVGYYGMQRQGDKYFCPACNRYVLDIS